MILIIIINNSIAQSRPNSHYNQILTLSTLRRHASVYTYTLNLMIPHTYTDSQPRLGLISYSFYYSSASAPLR